MIQRFIELGNGYADVYELLTLGKHMPNRIKHFVALHTVKDEKELSSLAIVMNPGTEGNLQPIYISLEGVPLNSQRYKLFEQLALELGQELKQLNVKHSSSFYEKSLFYQHLTAIFQMNRF